MKNELQGSKKVRSSEAVTAILTGEGATHVGGLVTMAPMMTENRVKADSMLSLLAEGQQPPKY